MEKLLVELVKDIYGCINKNNFKLIKKNIFKFFLENKVQRLSKNYYIREIRI